MRKIIAFIGGIDITDGRYDTPEFHLYKTINTLHAGDFYQNCTTGATSRTGPREPWQDIHALVVGPTALDILDNFVDRWYQQNLRFRDKVYYISEDEFNLDYPAQVPEELGGAWTVQLLRSITSDSAVMSQDRLEFLGSKYGAPLEDSIMRQYVNRIRSAKSFIYIENQYFMGSAFSWLEDQNTLCHHIIPIEIVEKIINKIEAGEQFHVYVTIPMYPEGDPTSAPSQEILRWQYRTMEMMFKRIHRALERNGSGNHPTDYLSIYCIGKRESPEEVPYSDLDDPAPGTGAEITRATLRHPIYVHSKLMIVDDEYLIVGSANINQRSLGGNRDSEICIGAFQPGCVHDGEIPRGSVHTFRVALWSVHLGGYDPAYEDPSSWDCLSRVREVSQEFWQIYTADEPTHSDIHLLPYPLVVSETGDLSALDSPWDTFPDTTAPVVGCKSGLLPAKLTT